MSYNTDFRGQLDLDFGKKSKKKVTEILKEIEDHESNWTSGENCIVWDEADDSEHFLDTLKDIIDSILKKHSVVANGTIKWRGEDMGDSGTIEVKDNAFKFIGGHI